MSFNNKHDTKNWITKTLPIDTFGVGKIYKGFKYQDTDVHQCDI